MYEVNLSWADWAVIGVNLLVTVGFGLIKILTDRTKKRQEASEEFLLGGRSLKMVPVGISLALSSVCSNAILGIPAEMYYYGTMYLWGLASYMIVALITAEVFIPIYYRLKLTSIYQYLELRFNHQVRCLMTVCFIVRDVLFSGTILYTPALAISWVSGMEIWVAILVSSAACVLYTAIGGMKAIVWTAVFQVVVAYVGFAAIIIQGLLTSGGVGSMWTTLKTGGRIDFFRVELDPRYRHTVWSVLIGSTFLWLSSLGVTQSFVQRYLSCATERDAKGSAYVCQIGGCITTLLVAAIGLIMYAHDHNCDPLQSGKVKTGDQLLLNFSMELFENYPGVVGLIVSGVFSGSISAVSCSVHACATVTIEDLIKPYTTYTNQRYSHICRGLVLGFGVLCVACALLASKLGGVLETGLCIYGVVGGPMIGVFILAFFFPFANSLGTSIGLVSGIAVTTWIYFGSKLYPKDAAFVRLLAVDTSRCLNETIYNADDNLPTLSNVTMEEAIYPAISSLYSVSYFYYSGIGFSVTIVVGLITSLLSGGWKNRLNVDPKLLVHLATTKRSSASYFVRESHITTFDSMKVKTIESNSEADDGFLEENRHKNADKLTEEGSIMLFSSITKQ